MMVVVAWTSEYFAPRTIDCRVRSRDCKVFDGAIEVSVSSHVFLWV